MGRRCYIINYPKPVLILLCTANIHGHFQFCIPRYGPLDVHPTPFAFAGEPSPQPHQEPDHDENHDDAGCDAETVACHFTRPIVWIQEVVDVEVLCGMREICQGQIEKQQEDQPDQVQ